MDHTLRSRCSTLLCVTGEQTSRVATGFVTDVEKYYATLKTHERTSRLGMHPGVLLWWSAKHMIQSTPLVGLRSLSFQLDSVSQRTKCYGHSDDTH